MKVEWRTGDLADLAFLRAESIDAAFSSSAVAEVDDASRLFRQVQRVLKPNGAFVFSYDASDVAVRRRRRRGRSLLLRPRTHRRRSATASPCASTSATSVEVFTELGRAGFRVDTILEPKPSTPGARIPDTIIWRARKEGA